MLTAPARRRVRILWFQYEISFAAYCFEWWEKLIVHAVLLSVLFLVSYGAYRQGAALWARLGALPWCARLALSGVLFCASAWGRGSRCGRAWRAQAAAPRDTQRSIAPAAPAQALARRAKVVRELLHGAFAWSAAGAAGVRERVAKTIHYGCVQ
jgi:hypothetical protein